MSDEKLIPDLKPAFGGGSIAIKRGKRIHAATLTYAFTNKEIRNKLYALTSAHLFTEGVNPMKLGDLVSYFRGNDVKDFDKAWELGRFIQSKRWQYEENDIDAALIYVGENNPQGKNLIAPGLLNGKIIMSTHVVTQEDINKKEKFYKVGISTGYTEGEILAIKTIKRVNYINKKGFTINKNQIVTDMQAKIGDSGALGVMKAEGKAVGMLGTVSNYEAAFSEIDTVLKAFDIEFLI